MFTKSISAIFIPIVFLLTLCTQNVWGQEKHLSARIISTTENLSTETPFSLAVAFNIQPDWHIYWNNPGDSGYKTEIKWRFDKDVNILEENITPTPYVVNNAGIINYVFKKSVLYKTKAQYKGDKNNFSLFVSADIKYLICKDVCIPEEITVERAFTLGSDNTASVDAPLFQKSDQRIAKFDKKITAKTTLNNNLYTMNISGISEDVTRGFIIPMQEGFLENAFKQIWEKTKGGYTLTFKKDTFSKETFKKAQVILNLDNRQFVKINTDIQAAPIKAEQPQTIEKNVTDKDVVSIRTSIKAEEKSPIQIKEKSFIEIFSISDLKDNKKLQLTLLFAFLGGLILNLMPCVLPVLSLKALSLIHHAKSKFSWWYGLVYTAGILATFNLLAFILISLKDSGASIGWGFQLQSPIFVAGIALLMLLVGLQLSSVFNFGTSFGRLQNLVSGHGTIATFFSGMLITVVATPCTAPFMATAIAFALAQPNDIIYVTFSALGFGLAFPYLAMTFSKRVLGLLPKPGAWEITFQHFLAFPMFATVLWLTWVYARQTSLDELYILLIAIFIVSLTTWIFGRLNVLSASKTKRWLGTFVFIGGIFYFFFTIHAFDHWYKNKSTSIAWQTWSTEAVQEGIAQGRPVFVNFTADWCITCKVNEKLVIDTEKTRRLIEEKGVLMLMGDWTSKNENISNELHKFDRYGVPLYLMYSTKSPNKPQILNQILTYNEFKKSIEKGQ